MENRKRRLTAATRRNYEALDGALVELMQEKDFGAISVIEICATAKVPRATFYNYFDDKYGLLEYSFSKLADRMAESDDEPGTKAYFEKLIVNVTDYVDNNRVLITRFWNADQGMGLTVLQNLLRNKFLENFRSRGYWLKIPVELVSEFYAGSVISMVKWWLENADRYNKAQVIEYLTLLVDPSRFM